MAELLWLILIASTVPYLREGQAAASYTEYLISMGVCFAVLSYYLLDRKASEDMAGKLVRSLRSSYHLILYAFSLVASYLLQQFYYNTDITTAQGLKIVGYFLVAVVGYVLIPILIYPARLKQFFVVLLSIGTFSAFLGLLSVFTGMRSFLGLRLLREDFSPLFGIQSIAGPFYEVNTYAVVLALGIVASIYFVNKREHRLIAAGAFLICSLALFFTWSRAMYLTVPLGITTAIFAKANPRQKKWLLISIFAFCLTVIVMFFTVPFLESLMQLDAGLTGRNILWRAAFEACLSRPLAGYGFGQDTVHEVMYRFGGIYHGIVKSSHNGFLEVGIQAGMLSAASFLLVFLISFFRLLKANIDTVSKISLGFGVLTTFIAAFFYTYVLGGASYTSLAMGIFWGLGNYAFLYSEEKGIIPESER